jgi:phosphotransferase system HPr-like phosphotransfer protein
MPNKVGLLKRITSSKRALVVVGVAGVVLLGSGIALAASLHSNNSTSKSSPAKPSHTNSTKKEAPDLSITTPDDNTEISDASVAVSGTVSADALVTINDSQAQVDGTAFSGLVSLKVGKNTITVVATGKDGTKTIKSITVTRTQQAAQTPTITLTGKYGYLSSGGLGASISWRLDNVAAGKGFYVLRSSTSQPTYPANLVTTVADGTLSFSQRLPLDGTTYYFRVCQIAASGNCGVYSNVLPIAAQVPSSGTTLSNLKIIGTTATWESSKPGTYGFLLLWSPDSDPTFPSSGTVYQDTTFSENPIGEEGYLNHDLISGTTYYVRACENLGGKCGAYSNQITVTAP